MLKDNLHNDYADLIMKYLSGNANDAETRQLEEWVMAAPENRKQFQTSKKAWMMSRKSDLMTDQEVASIWEATEKQLSEEPKVVPMKPRSNRRVWLQWAAAAALLVGTGLLFLNFPKGEKEMHFATAEERQEAMLPDGSQVILNQNSEVTYLPDSENDLRLVDLRGDAFFDVARDEKRPFKIITGDVKIEVLGTSFYVDARAQEAEVQVVVASGSVAVVANGQKTILKKGETATYKKSTKQLARVITEDANFQFLKTKTLVFESTPLQQVVDDLNRSYGGKIQIAQGSLSDCELTATYKNKSLPAVVKIIEASLGIETKQTDSGIVFSGQCEE